MLDRSTQLESMLNATQQLDELHRDIDRWIDRTQAELDNIDYSLSHESDASAQSPIKHPLSPETSRKRLQDLTEKLHEGELKLNRYQSEAESLCQRFSQENTSKIGTDLQNINDQWIKLNSRLNSLLRSAQKGATSDLDAGSSQKLLNRIQVVEHKADQLTAIAADLLQQSDPISQPDQRSQFNSQLQSLQLELNSISAQMQDSTRRSNQHLSSLPDGQVRLQKVREKVTSLRQSFQTTPNYNMRFLSRLKETNQWLSHCDAAFHELNQPLKCDFMFVFQLREATRNLMKDMEAHRSQVEELLQQGRLHFGEEALDTMEGRESEVDSDGSEMASRNASDSLERDTASNLDDQLSSSSQKRAVRRIRRHLYALRRRWDTLSTKMTAHKQRLDSFSERISHFQSLWDDAVEQVTSAHQVAARLIPIDSIPPDRLQAEFEQNQSFYEACAPLTVLFNNLDRQILQFQDSQIIVEPELLSKLSALRRDYEAVRLMLENRLQAMDQTVTSVVQPLPQTIQESVRPVDGTMPVSSSTPVPLYDSVCAPWERCVHPSGSQVPYYKNHSTHETQWDHPILCDMMQSMKHLNTIRFPDYRTALKLRRLQKTLCLDSVSISIIAESLKHIGHSQPIESPGMDPFDRRIFVPQMIECLMDLFNRASSSCASNQTGTNGPERRGSSHRCGFVRLHSSSQRRKLSADEPRANSNEEARSFDTHRSRSLPLSGNLATDSTPRASRSRQGSVRRRLQLQPTRQPISVCVDLTLNWLLNVYDRMRKGSISVLSFKVALILLSVAELDDKYRYLFGLIANREGNVTEQRFSALLRECILIARNLGEAGWMGKNGESAAVLKQCFNQAATMSASTVSNGASDVSISFRAFLAWLRVEPRVMIWLPLLHRLMLAEQVRHNVRCGFCQNQPLIGLRYRCLRCLNFDLCQHCFFNGRTARGHKVTHPMQEYCNNSTSADSLRDFTRIVRNRFRSRERSIEPRDPRNRVGCCESTIYAEGKPRPAPAIGTECESQPWKEGKSSSNQLYRDASFTSTSHSLSLTQLPPSHEAELNSQLPPTPMRVQRAVSDTRNPFLSGYPANSNGQTPVQQTDHFYHNFSSMGLSNPVEESATDEHQLIAGYSRNLRQQSEPELLFPMGPGQGVMNRSTISDGLPVSQLAEGHLMGHRSLDRHRSPFMGTQQNGFQAGRHTALGMPQTRSDRFYPISSDWYLNRDLYQHAPSDLYAQQQHVKRSYSMRARSQPPSDPAAVQLQSRLPWQQAVHNNQVIRSLEDEKRALQLEYDRLRARVMSPNVSKAQLQQAQQRFLRMQYQHQQLQQQELMRAYLAKSHSQRLPSHRPPSAGANVPLNMGQPGRLHYTGSLGRSAQPAVNGLRYSVENVTPTADESQESRMLREHKERLEVRMQLLEEQNRQLGQQLQRLRQCIVAGAASGQATKLNPELLIERPTPEAKMSLRQRSASGGLASQPSRSEGRSVSGSGSVGQLTGVKDNECDPNQSTQSQLAEDSSEYYRSVTEEAFPTRNTTTVSRNQTA